jgi:hypothetical protein
MVMIGVAYLSFEKSIPTNSSSQYDSAAPAKKKLSRALIGVQAGKLLGNIEALTNRN